MKPSELLTKYEWCQGAMAKNFKGQIVDLASADAVKFCVYGAILKCSDNTALISDMYSKLSRAINDTDIAWWNDTLGRTKQQVITALKKAGL